MPARTGEQFLKGLKGPREVWVDGERVRDVVDHPKLGGAAHALAEVFDLHHRQADALLMADPETGEKIAVSHMIPRSREDLARRHKALRAVAEYSVGLMGRTPDYMNVTYAGFAGSPVEWSAHGNEAGQERLVAYQKFLRRHDISLTHTIVQPTVDKATGDAPVAGNEHALRKVGETANGIVVRGARVLATLAPFADEIAVYPAAPLPQGADLYALSFCIPMGTPGLKFLCRDSMSAPRSNRFDHPLSSRFDEQDAFVIFDNVEVPRERLFIDCNLKSYNSVMTASWPPNVQQQTMIRASVKLDFAWGLALRMAASINAADPETMRMIGELWGYAEFTRAAVLAAEAEAREWPGGMWTCAASPLLTDKPMRAKIQHSEKPNSTISAIPPMTPSTLAEVRKSTMKPISSISTTVTTLRVVSASTRPPSTAVRLIGNDFSRSSNPLFLSSARPMAVLMEPNAMVCTKMPGIR